MNIFNKVALQGLKKNHTRTLVTVIGVALSAALITGVATFVVSLQNYMINGAVAKYGSWHVEIPDADSAFLMKQEGNSRVKNVVALQNVGYALLEGGENPDKPYLFLTGWNEDALDSLPVNLISGRLPRNSGEVVIPEHLASNGGVQIALGDTLELAFGNRMRDGQILDQHDPYCAGEETLTVSQEKIYTVVGICQRPSIEEYSAPGYTLITTEDTMAADSLTAFVTLKNPYRVHSYTDDISDSHGYVLNDDVLRFMGVSGNKIFTLLLCAVGGILVVLVMLGSVFLIYNSFNISLNERTHQFGILMSVGATAKQLRSSVLFEGLCIGVVGIPLGILIGIPSIQFVISLVRKNFANIMYDNVPLELKVSVPMLIISAVVSMVTVLISAYVPAKKASDMSVMECIRQTNEIKMEAKTVKISRFAQHFYGLEGVLALKNFKRNKQRYRSIVLSLSLSVVLFVSADSFGIYLGQLAKNSDVVVEDYDICFSTREMDENKLLRLYDSIKIATGVYESSYQALSTYSCVLDTADLTSHFLEEYGKAIGYDGKSDTVEVRLDMQSVADDAYRDFLERNGLSEEEYSGQDDSMVMAGFLPGKWYMQEQPMEFTLASESGEQSKTIRATFVKDYPDLLPAKPSEQTAYSLMVIAPYRVKAQFDALDAVVEPVKLGMTFKSKNPGQSVRQMREMINSAGVTADKYTLYNVYGILEENRNMVFIVNLFSVVFIMMITLIAVANVFNTISTNIKLRRKELAMLRSVGMSERDFNKMMRFECVFYGVRTMLWGLPIAGIFSCLIYGGMAFGGGEFKFIFPWKSMTVSVAGVILIVFITMLYAVSKIKKENIIDALRDDMA
ncbi:ABC transporter permease [Bariatricus sp. SGI.154]|uniref:ABC transporter permease n=1 Tax=Bariatricus sp. SGI.154 TaxID=3420549 RepID=UPI003CFBE510